MSLIPFASLLLSILTCFSRGFSLLRTQSVKLWTTTHQRIAVMFIFFFNSSLIHQIFILLRKVWVSLLTSSDYLATLGPSHIFISHDHVEPSCISLLIIHYVRSVWSSSAVLWEYRVQCLWQNSTLNHLGIFVLNGALTHASMQLRLALFLDGKHVPSSSRLILCEFLVFLFLYVFKISILILSQLHAYRSLMIIVSNQHVLDLILIILSSMRSLTLLTFPSDLIMRQIDGIDSMIHTMFHNLIRFLIRLCLKLLALSHNCIPIMNRSLQISVYVLEFTHYTRVFSNPLGPPLLYRDIFLLQVLLFLILNLSLEQFVLLVDWLQKPKIVDFLFLVLNQLVPQTVNLFRLNIAFLC